VEFSISFEPGNALCVYRLKGQATPAELLACFAAARQDPRWSDDYDFLTVLDHVSLGDMTPEAMRRMMTSMRDNDTARPSFKRRGAIVCNDPLSQALLAYWEVAAKHRLLTEERIFRFENQARLWLRSARREDEAATGGRRA
jgi:hypothetical protein